MGIGQQPPCFGLGHPTPNKPRSGVCHSADSPIPGPGGPGLWSRFCGARARAETLSTLGGPPGGGPGSHIPGAPHPVLLSEMSELDEAADFEVSDDDSKEGSDISESVSTRTARGARGSHFKNRGSARAGTSAQETSNKTPSDREAGLRQLLLKFQRRRGQKGQ